ncbi:BMA-HIP-1 [Dirofilaria immitis]|nr:BMA-HIP-1 [Dirofilaria immitis]
MILTVVESCQFVLVKRAQRHVLTIRERRCNKSLETVSSVFYDEGLWWYFLLLNSKKLVGFRVAPLDICFEIYLLLLSESSGRLLFLQARKILEYNRNKERCKEEKELKERQERIKQAQEARKREEQEKSGFNMPKGFEKIFQDSEVMNLLQDESVLAAYMDIINNPANIAKHMSNPKMKETGAKGEATTNIPPNKAPEPDLD